MELLAAAILVSTVLVLVDKNHAWTKCWKVAKWPVISLVVLFLFVLGFGAYTEHQREQARKEIPPKTLPANFNNWDK